MKKLFFIPCMLVLLLASCGGNSKKACYEISVSANGQSESMYVYTDETGADVQASEMKNRFVASGKDKDAISVNIRKLDKSESDCRPVEIKRTVKPTASFMMTIEGVNPDGYTPWYSGVMGICNGFDVSCRYVNTGGHTSSSLMSTRISTGLSYEYTDVTFREYVQDNSYVGGRMICLNPYITKSIEYLTADEKISIGQTMDNFLTGTPDGPFTIKKKCIWNFRLGRDSSYTYVDEIIETYANSVKLKEALLACDANNPLFQSLYYYDAERDEFILQDRKTWNIK